MYITKQEDIKNKTISGIVTTTLFSLIALFLILHQMVTPNPPFPIGNSIAAELTLDIANEGNDIVDYNTMSASTSVSNKEEFLTAKESDVTIKQFKETKHPLKELSALEQLTTKFRNTKGKTGGGIGDNEKAGEQGDPNGNSNLTKTAGIVTGLPTTNGFQFDLKNSQLLKLPQLPKDAQEEGKVVVTITVSSDGSVTEADANGRGTTTSSATLKAKARQMALVTKFNTDLKNPERRGTITIIFAFE